MKDELSGGSKDESSGGLKDESSGGSNDALSGTSKDGFEEDDFRMMKCNSSLSINMNTCNHFTITFHSGRKLKNS